MSGFVEMPEAQLGGCRRAHEQLADVIADLGDDVARRPSLLPTWSIGHVLAHLARNAEAMCRRIDAATRGELVHQYEGGAEGRAAQIEAGAHLPADQLVSDVVGWSTKLDETFASLPADCWGRPIRTVSGEEHPVASLPFRRWREVEVHLVDLGMGFTPAQWSEELVEQAVPRLLAGLPDRSDPRALMAWMLGRGPAPNLEPWG